MDDKKNNTNTPIDHDNKQPVTKPTEVSNLDNKQPVEQPKVPVDNLFDTKEPPKDTLKLTPSEQKIQFGSAGVDDINRNLGSFGSTMNGPAQPETKELKLEVDKTVVEKAAKEKINFERFSKTKKTEKAAKTKFGEKVGIMLRSKKGFRTTWALEITFMVVVIAVAAALIGFLYSPWIGQVKDGPLLDPFVKQCINVGTIFCWISIFPCVIPLIYLLVAWFVGINQVASSRTFHYMFWICGMVSLACFIVGFGLCMVPCAEILAYPGYSK